MNDDQTVVEEVRYHPAGRLLILAAAIVLLLIAVAGILAYRLEGASFGRYLAGLFLLIGGYVCLVLLLAPASVQFLAGHLVLRRPLGRLTLPYEQITAVRQTRALIILETRHQTVRLHKLLANTDAYLMVALERHVPAGRRQRAQRRQPTFPYQLRSKRLGPAVLLVMGVGMILFAGATTVYIFTTTEPIGLGQGLLMGLLVLVGAGFGLGTTIGFFWHFIWRYDFTAEAIVLRRVLRTSRYPAHDIRQVRVVQETVTVRGFDRIVSGVLLTYADGRELKLEPNRFGFPMDYTDAEEAARAVDLAAQLQHLYLPR